MLKRLIRSATPAWAIMAYHDLLARFAALWYRRPSEGLVVIGVTGTNGKSTTVHFLGRLLEHAGFKVGWTTTVDFKVAGHEWVNDQKMTMLGRFQTQKLLRDMVNAGCDFAIVETSSQGIAQHRHVGINYDVAVFTNLTPEHIEAHGGFENYKHAKGKLFSHLANSRRKRIRERHIDKVSVVNTDDEHAPYFLSFRTDRQYGYGFNEGKARDAARACPVLVPVLPTDPSFTGQGSTFTLKGQTFRVHPLGRFNAYNALAAATAMRALGISWEVIRDGVERLTSVPGRLESINEGQSFGVIVDYAYEPAALNAVYETLALLPRKRLIHVVGSAGGGRDVSRRAIIGTLAAQMDDVVIVTNEDPYDDDPQEIIDQIADAARAAGKREETNLFRVLDRQQAIDQAIHLAQPGDLVLITGKGCEPVMAVADGKKLPWDDRAAVRRALHSRKDSYAH